MWRDIIMLVVWCHIAFAMVANSRPITHKNPERVPMDFSDIFERSPKSQNVEDRRPEYKPSIRKAP